MASIAVAPSSMTGRICWRRTASVTPVLLWPIRREMCSEHVELKGVAGEEPVAADGGEQCHAPWAWATFASARPASVTSSAAWPLIAAVTVVVACWVDRPA
jgi:hypothetical protein